MEGSLTSIVEKARLNTLLMCNEDKLAKSTSFINPLTQCIIGKTFFITTILSNVKMPVDRILENV